MGEQLLTQFYRAVTSLVRKTSDLEDAYRALCIVQRPATAMPQGGGFCCETKASERQVCLPVHVCLNDIVEG